MQQVCILFLIVATLSITSATKMGASYEQAVGFFIGSDGTECKYCSIPCGNLNLKSTAGTDYPMFEKYQYPFYNYGCHKDGLCVARRPSTAELYTMIGFCVLYNGCVLNTKFPEYMPNAINSWITRLIRRTEKKETKDANVKQDVETFLELQMALVKSKMLRRFPVRFFFRLKQIQDARDALNRRNPLTYEQFKANQLDDVNRLPRWLKDIIRFKRVTRGLYERVKRAVALGIELPEEITMTRVKDKFAHYSASLLPSIQNIKAIETRYEQAPQTKKAAEKQMLDQAKINLKSSIVTTAPEIDPKIVSFTSDAPISSGGTSALNFQQGESSMTVLNDD